jgi:eukaryotic-like serine/threonine-protein kinase
VWSPHGDRIVFASVVGSGFDLLQQSVSATEPEILIKNSGLQQIPTSWSEDERFLLYTVLDPKTKNDVWVLPLDTHKPTRLLGTEFNEKAAYFSPDGKWIAYESDESGRNEVYVRPSSAGLAGAPPSLGPKQLVSKGGGTNFLKWHGKELLYRSPGGNLMSVEVSHGSVVEEPKSLSKSPPGVSAVDIAPDGQRFLIAMPVGQAAPPPLTVVLNWQAGLKRF